jgi:hypothetical protein
MLYRVVGIDPGLTTGLVAFTVDESGISDIESYELDLVGVGHYLTQRPWDVMAYEVANKFQASGHMSSETIGLARYFCLLRNTDFIPVTQSSHKKLITRPVLKRAGLYVPGGHAKDAAGVALFHVVTKLSLMQAVLHPEVSE